MEPAEALVSGDGDALVASGDSDALVASGDSGPDVARLVASHVLDVPDFPQPGILFKDLTPLLGDGEAFRGVVDAIGEHYSDESSSKLARGTTHRFDVVAGVEARGFVLAAAVAYATGVGVVPVRKAGKLPRATLSASYDLEYGTATLELHSDAFIAGARVLVVDDVLATGGTAAAALDLVERAGGTVAGFTVVLELAALGGRRRLSPRQVHALLTV